MSNYCFGLLESDNTIDKVQVLDKGEIAYTFTLRNKQVPFEIVR